MSHGLAKFPGRSRHRRRHRADHRRRATRRSARRSPTPKLPRHCPTIEVEAPTLRIYLGPNTSPFKGTEGDFTTSRQIAERLRKELETNVGLRVEQHDKGFLVSGRGELHLSVLIETMRREGFELEVGRPQVVTTEIEGETFEPVEEVVDRGARRALRSGSDRVRTAPRRDEGSAQRERRR